MLLTAAIGGVRTAFDTLMMTVVVRVFNSPKTKTIKDVDKKSVKG